MKLLHCADIHLDSPMRGLARYDGAPVDQLRLATRQALGNLVDLAVGERVDVVVIAGDLFDGDWQDHGTGACFARAMSRLHDHAIPVVTLAGNHDAASRITKSLRMPPNVRTLPVDAPGTVLLEDIGLAVHGQGFATRAVTDDLSAGYPAPVAGVINIGVLHTSADGREGHEPYAPCRPERLAAHGYDYWALGHVHQREVLVEDPPVVFAGCLQGRHVREAGPKGATLVEVGGTAPRLTAHALDEVRWAVCEIDATGADLDEVHGRIADGLAASVDEADGRFLAVRVRITGATPAHADLLADHDQLRTEVVLSAESAARGEAWVEKVVVHTAAQAQPTGEGDEAVAEVLRTIRRASVDDAATAALAEELGPLAAKLPPEVRRAFDPSDPAVVRELLGDVERLLPARLGRAA